MRGAQSVRAKARSWEVRGERLDWPDPELTQIRLHGTIYYSLGRMDELQQLQEWCISQCNEDWEHTYGVKIDARQARPNPLHPQHGAHHNG